METGVILLITIILLALFFDYVNGFHDSANAIATVVSTKVLTPRQAVLMAAFWNLTGALITTEVAKTLGGKLVPPEKITLIVVLSALIGGIVWNLITWYFGLPSSSSHALTGGLIGSVVTSYGLGLVNWKIFLYKIVLPSIIAPFLGVLAAFTLMTITYWIFWKTPPAKANKLFRHLQLLSASLMAFSHGSNDAQKSMGIITMALVSMGALHHFQVPLWVKILCALMMALGTAAGGWRIIRTMGMKMVKIKPYQGFVAETSAAGVIMGASFLGMPISTTYVITSAIMGVGMSKKITAVKWSIVANIIAAWILTIPMSAIIGGATVWVLTRIL